RADSRMPWPRAALLRSRTRLIEPAVLRSLRVALIRREAVRGSHPGSPRCHLSRRPPSYPPRRPQPRRRLVRRDRRGTVSALGAELSSACRAGIALVVTLGGILAVDTHDGPSGYRCCSIGHDPAVKVCRSFTETRSALRSGSSP